MSTHVRPATRHAGQSQPRRERGFTLLEVVVAMAVLSAIIVPLTASLIQVIRETRSTSSRLDQSNDHQRITSAWTKDVLSLDLTGLKQSGPCYGAVTGGSGTDILTFQWDQASVAAGSGQAALVPKTATWAVVGTGPDMRLVRRYCEAGVAISESTLARHIGVAGQGPTATVHGPGGPGSSNFCDATTCTLVISGSFDMNLKVARRVAGSVATDATPPPPTITNVTPHNAYLTVDWTPPSALPSGVSAITGYRVEAWTSPTGGLAGSAEINASSNSADITGLVNGTDYWIVAYSKNVVGQGDPSAVYGPVQPNPTVPSQPQTVTVSTVDLPVPDSLRVAWTPPSDDGGAAIDGYKVEGQRNDGAPVSMEVGGSTTSATFDLDPDWSYTFTVSAHNSLGWGPPSDPASGSTRPPKPTAVTASASNARALVTFTIAGNGNVPLASSNSVRITATCVTPSASCTDRTYVMDRGGPASLAANGTFGPLDTSTAAGASPLVNGQSYTITVELKNTNGAWGPVSEPSAAVTPLDKPVAPTSVISIKSNEVSHQLLFTFAAGLESGGSPITSYVVSGSGGRTITIPAGVGGAASQTWDGTASGQSWPAFTDFTGYTFTATACNAQGCSPATPSLSAIPGVVPQATLVTVRGSTPRTVQATATVTAGTTTTFTKWTVYCGATSAGSIGANLSVGLTNVTVGNQDCSGYVWTELASVTNGVAGITTVQGATLHSTVDVYGAPGTPTAPTVTAPATGAVTSAVVAATNTPSSGGTNAGIEWQATCGGQTSTWGPSPRTVTGLTQGSTVTCFLVARSTTSLYVSANSPNTTYVVQRISPTLVSAYGSKTIPVQESGSNDFPSGRFHALVVLRADPGLSVSGMRSNLQGSTSGSYSTSNFTLWKQVANGNDMDYYVWVTITPPNGNWPGIGSTRAVSRTATMDFQLSGQGAVTGAQITYWVIAEWNSSGNQDYPAAYAATGAYGSTLAAGQSFSYGFTCDDNDTDFFSSDDACDYAKIRIRNLVNDQVIQISTNVDANDGSTRSYTATVPSGIASGRWVIEAEFCNENGSCPASPPGGYDGNDHQLLGYFTVL